MNYPLKNKFANKAMRELTEEDLKFFRFVSIHNDNPLLCYYLLSNPRYEIKVDVWGVVYMRRKIAMSYDWSEWLEIIVRDYSHFVQTIETFTNL